MQSLDFKNTIGNLSNAYFDEIKQIRQYLHQHPELSFQEHHTSQFICSKLKEFGIPYKSGYAGGTGIVATINGKSKGKVIALRADMDALPINEKTSVTFSSKNENVMHACGHDAHSASLLGTAKILTELKDQWSGTVLLIFQPGEETFPGGAKLLIEEGALNDPKPEIIIGQHVLPEMETGCVGFKEGIYMASGDEVYITISGKGGHAAMPHTTADTVLTASHIIVSLQQIVSRFVPATIPTVLSFGKIIANGATNIIPEKVEIAGTLRTMNEEWRAKIKLKIAEIAQSIAQSMGASCDVIINDGYPMVYNNETITANASKFAQEYLGSDKVIAMETRMTAEDFGYYTQKFPCTFYRFGVKQENGVTGSLHTPIFNLNEEALVTSMGTMAYIAIQLLNN